MRARRLEWLIAGLIAASLAVNGVLFARWRAAAAQPEAAAEPRAPRKKALFSEAWSRPLPRLRTADPRAAEAQLTLESCQGRATEIEHRLADLARLRQRSTPPALRWKQAAANESLTTALTAELRKQRAAKDPAIRAECRGRLCRLFLADTVRDADWVRQVKESAWRNQNLREIAADESGILLEQQETEVLQGSALLQGALQDFESSGAVERCQKKFRGQGTLDAHVSLAPEEGGSEDEPPGVSVRAGGPLLGTPLGDCIDGELRRALAAVTLPPRFEPVMVLAQYPKL